MSKISSPSILQREYLNQTWKRRIPTSDSAASPQAQPMSPARMPDTPLSHKSIPVNAWTDIVIPTMSTILISETVERRIVIPAISAAEIKRRVAAYCRVSTDLPEQETSLMSQEHHYRDLVDSHSEWELVGMYVDQGSSGTNVDRPQFQTLLSDCRRGVIDIILVKSISRFGRNMTETVSIIRELTQKGIRVVFEKEHLDTASMGTELMLTLLSMFAEEESRSISSNVKWNIQKRFEDGSYVIGKPAYGYRKSDNGEYEIISDEADNVRLMFDMMMNGRGCYEICDALNRGNIPSPSGKAWSQNAVRKILRNEFYKGDLLLQKTYSDELFQQRTNRGEQAQYLVKNDHAAIVSEKVFDRVQELLDLHNTRNTAPEKVGAGGTTTGKTLSDGATADVREGTVTPEADTPALSLSGLLICGICGKRLNRDGENRYRCMSGSSCRIVVHAEDLQSAFCTMLNRLTYSQTLPEAKQVLTVYARKASGLKKEICKAGSFVSVYALRKAVTVRPISETLSSSDAELFHEYVEQVYVLKERFRFCFKCGLVLEEKR